ncbi:MAG: hypothetical protein ACFCU4_06930 [Puniceicoccaceae bacterium]
MPDLYDMQKIFHLICLLLIPSCLLAGIAEEINKTKWARVSEESPHESREKHGLPHFKYVTFYTGDNILLLDYLISSSKTKKSSKGMTSEVDASWGHDRFRYKEISLKVIHLYSVVDETKPRYEITFDERSATIKDLEKGTLITVNKIK